MSQSRLVVDPIACTGHGLCAELFPERIAADDWGYPIVDPEPIGPRERASAQRAVDACPALALALMRAGAPATARSTAAPTGGASGPRGG
jgi:ferredoxin